jgi:hypothetical protein
MERPSSRGEAHVKPSCGGRPPLACLRPPVTAVYPLSQPFCGGPYCQYQLFTTKIIYVAYYKAWPDGVRVPLPPAGRGAHAPAGGSARPRRDAPLYRQPLAMHHGAVRLEDISVTSAPIQWTPGPPLG